MDYPDYTKGASEPFVLGQGSPDRFERLAILDKTEHKKKMQSFMQDLLQDDAESYPRLLELMEILHSVGIDQR